MGTKETTMRYKTYYKDITPSQKQRVITGLRHNLTIPQIAERTGIAVGWVNRTIEEKFKKK